MKLKYYFITRSDAITTSCVILGVWIDVTASHVKSICKHVRLAARKIITQWRPIMYMSNSTFTPTWIINKTFILNYSWCLKRKADQMVQKSNFWSSTSLTGVVFWDTWYNNNQNPNRFPSDWHFLFVLTRQWEAVYSPNDPDLCVKLDTKIH